MVQGQVEFCISTRSWCVTNGEIIRYLLQFPDLGMSGTRYWEYPFVFKEVMKRPNSRILDMGIGRGVFASILKSQGQQVFGVDTFEGEWSKYEKRFKDNGIRVINADCRKLPIKAGEFDITLLISVIEHVPSNTIFCEKRRVTKTGEMLRAENPEKINVIKEAFRVIKPGGVLILTSDIYLDHPTDMNISWRDLIGVEGLDRCDVKDLSDVYVVDNPIHKGRVCNVGLVFKKM